MLIPREKKDGRGHFPPSTYLSSLREALNCSLPPSGKLLFILQSPRSYRPSSRKPSRLAILDPQLWVPPSYPALLAECLDPHMSSLDWGILEG